MPRKDLKNRTPVGSAMDNKIYYEMKAYSEKTGIPISKILDKAMSMYSCYSNIGNLSFKMIITIITCINAINCS